MKSEKPTTKRLVPLIIAIVVLVAIIAIAVPTVAYYIINANDGGNEYTPAEPGDPSFNLDSNNKEMKNVSIAVEDKGYPVYVRVAIVITWQKQEDGENEVFFQNPVVNVDYTIDFNTNGWTSFGGYYYCTSPVASGKTTDVLINSCELVEGGGVGVPDGYTLNVEIIVQTVQAVGATDNGDVPAWRDAWKNSPEF